MTFAEERQLFNTGYNNFKEEFNIRDSYGFGIKEFQFEGFVNADPVRRLDNMAAFIANMMTDCNMQIGRYNGDMPFDYYANCVDVRGATQNASHYIGTSDEMSMKFIIDTAIARMNRGCINGSRILTNSALILPYVYQDSTHNIKIFLISARPVRDLKTNKEVYPKNLSAAIVYDRSCYTNFNKIILGVNYDMIFGDGFKILPGLNYRRDNVKRDVITTITDVNLMNFMYNVFGYVKYIQDCDINKVQTTNIALDAYAKHNPTWKGIGCVPLTYYNLCKVIALCAEPMDPIVGNTFLNPEDDPALYKSEVLNGRSLNRSSLFPE